MCIRDSVVPASSRFPYAGAYCSLINMSLHHMTCLLYTSDAADDLTRVDLGGRRFFQAEDGIRDLVRSRGLGDVYKRQCSTSFLPLPLRWCILQSDQHVPAPYD